MQQIILNGLDVNELKAIISNVVKESLPKPPPKLYTRTETANRLCISLPTLDSYIKNGWLKATRINNRSVRISEDAIQEAMQTIKTLRTKNRL
jgi:excisionase family DNA binding protein|tara:strand:+ start:226 stop:504 length:279 start_codon:yes stop_codon:yes gene_type:complete